MLNPLALQPPVDSLPAVKWRPATGRLSRQHASRKAYWWCSWLLLLLPGLLSCGSIAGTDPPPPVIVTVSPNMAQVGTSATNPFSVSVQNSPGAVVTWEVNGVAGGNLTIGTIDSNGLYMAPTQVPTPPTVTVEAALQTNPSDFGTASVTIINSNPTQGPITIKPGLAGLTTSQSQSFQATGPGIDNTQVNWAVDGMAGGNPATGTISSAGVYTSGAAGAHIITAALKANPAVIGAATAQVTDLGGVFTWRNDNSRSGVNAKELVLTPGTQAQSGSVAPSTFGKLFSCPVDGEIYAQPLYVANLTLADKSVRNVVIAATENDTVFAFDADTNPCVTLWKTPLVPAGETPVIMPTLDGLITSTDITPVVGITGTPVIDPASSTLYVVAKTVTPATQQDLTPLYHQRLYALDLATGAPKIQPNGVTIAAAVPGSADPTDGRGNVMFTALYENQRAALLLAGGVVYAAFASHGEQGTYHGWVLAYDATTLQQTGAFVDTPNGMKGGIWQSGGGPSADSSGSIFAVTGKGTFNFNIPGAGNIADSVVKLLPAPAISVADYFAPCNQATQQNLGSSSALLLPDSAGSAAAPHLLATGGQDGNLYVFNRDALGQYTGHCPDAAAQVVATGDGPILSTPLFWQNALYVAAGNGKLKAFPLSNGQLSQTPTASQSPEAFGAQGVTPAVSANGNANGIIWLIDSRGALAQPNTAAILRAFDASNLSREIYNSATAANGSDSAGLAVKFAVPVIANGKVYVGTQSELDVYGLLPQ